MAAAKLQIHEVTQHIGSVPFFYSVAVCEKEGHRFKAIYQMTVKEGLTAPAWVYKLKEASESDDKVPVEVIEEAFIKFAERPEWWVKIFTKAFANIFGNIPTFWEDRGTVFGMNNINFFRHVQ